MDRHHERLRGGIDIRQGPTEGVVACAGCGAATAPPTSVTYGSVFCICGLFLVFCCLFFSVFFWLCFVCILVRVVLAVFFLYAPRPPPSRHPLPPPPPPAPPLPRPHPPHPPPPPRPPPPPTPPPRPLQHQHPPSTPPHLSPPTPRPPPPNALTPDAFASPPHVSNPAPAPPTPRRDAGSVGDVRTVLPAGRARLSAWNRPVS